MKILRVLEVVVKVAGLELRHEVHRPANELDETRCKVLMMAKLKENVIAIHRALVGDIVVVRVTYIYRGKGMAEIYENVTDKFVLYM